MSKKKIRLIIMTIACIAAIVTTISEYFSQDNVFSGNGSPENSEFTVHMVDVGQGDCVFIDNKDMDIIIDAGTNDSCLQMISYLDSIGCTDIEYAIFTHPHEDHIGGADELMAKYNIKNVLMSKVAADSACYRDLTKASKNEKATVRYPRTGDEIQIGDAKITVLSADTKVNEKDLNLASLVVRIDYKNVSYLFTGDAEKQNENYMLNSRYSSLLDTDLYKAAHHGSSTSNTEKFLNKVSPEIILIPVGKDNDYGHPHTEILTLFTQITDNIYRTDLDGSVVICTDGEKLWKA